MKLTKRNGDLVDFDVKKIVVAVEKAFRAVNVHVNDVQKIVEYVISKIGENPDVTSSNIVPIELVQNYVEESLMANRHFDVAKAYILYRKNRAEQRLTLPQEVSQELAQLAKESSAYFDNDVMREFVYCRTYSKYLEDKGRREFWPETVDRYMSFMRENVGDKISEEDYAEIRMAILKNEVMPSMRLLQFAGPAARRCNVCIYNCAYVAPETFKDLADICYILMLGTGIGFSIESVHVNKFPIIKFRDGTPVIKYIVDDSKEGWANCIQFALEIWFNGGDVDIDYSKLRPAGARLKTMGGRSAGPQPLIDLMIFMQEIIKKRVGFKLTTLDMYDIICKIGQIVVSGSSRRSALISLSDFHDTDIRDAKKGCFWVNQPQRSMANNSAAYNEKPSQVDFMKEWLALAESGTGERGLWVKSGLKDLLPKKRLNLLTNHFGNQEFLKEMGTNPCVELILLSRQFCNLTEVVCRENDTVESLLRKIRLATIMGTYQSSLTKFGYIDSRWKSNQELEHLLGVSLTGQWDCPIVRNIEVLKTLRDYVIKVNDEYAPKLGINSSTSVTVVKPSGTTSQLTNSSSGMHPRFSKYYIRRIRISVTDPLLQLMKAQGYKVVPEVGQNEETANTFVLDFPTKAPDNAITVKDLTAIQQLEYWKLVRLNYVTHNPSITVYIKPDEWLVVGLWVWNNFECITGLSFLPVSEHVYQLAPYEEISKEKYEELVSNMTKVDFSKLIHYEKSDMTDIKREPACANGVCEL